MLVMTQILEGDRTAMTAEGRDGTSQKLPAETDVIGRAVRGRMEDLAPGKERELLAVALGVSAEAIAGMSDADVNAALGRLRTMSQSLQQLAAAAAIDELTGALRRGAGLELIRREIARFRRIGGKGLSVAFLDVNGLKRLNDTHGHDAGDRMLQTVTEVARERLRTYDVIIRWGGDEFVCLLTDATAAEAERTMAEIERHVTERGAGSGISVGIAELRPDDTPETLVTRADAALLAARAVSRTGGR